MNQAPERYDVEDVVKRFESCETAKDAFRHQDHLAVAVYYVEAFDVATALTRMRESLHRFLDHHQIDRQKYHETLTVFWIEMVAKYLRSSNEKLSLSEKCRKVQEAFGNKDFALEFYSPEVLWSDAARRSFIAPDKKSWK